jgi:chorismate mutase-like protein
MNSDHELTTLRAELDRIDDFLQAALADRIDCCVRIADYKSRHDVPMMQPHRIGVVQSRAAVFAAAHGIDTDFIRRFYDLIIAETCRVEDLIIRSAPVDRGHHDDPTGSHADSAHRQL